MPDLHRPCPVTGCDHEETVPRDTEAGGQDDPSHLDLWDHVATWHAGGIASLTGALMAGAALVERANPGDTRPGDCPICGPISGCRCPKTMQVSNLRMEAMQDGEWVEVPGITSAEIGFEPEPAPPPTVSFLAQRLIDRHGLDPAAAERAVACATRGEDGPHVDLVRAEVSALVTELGESMNRALREMVAALMPAFKAAAEAVQRAAKTTQADFQLVQGVRRARKRPAWQSTYGPPQTAHRPTR